MLNLRSVSWFTALGCTTETNVVNIPSLSSLEGITQEGFETPLFILSDVKLSEYEYKSCGNVSVAVAGKNIILICADENADSLSNEQEVMLYNLLTGKNITYEELADELFKQYIDKYVQNKFKDERKRLSKEIDDWAGIVSNAKANLLLYTDKIYKNQMILETGFEEKYTEKIKQEISNIKNHKKCKEIHFEEGKLCIDTEYLYITEPITEKRFDLGSCKMMFDLTRADVKIKNLTQTKDGYWYGCQHPHVDDNGHPCFGNTAGQIAVYLGDNDIYACYLLMIGYLQTCDINDSAGYYVGSWDEVDKDGNLISSANGEKRGLESDGNYYDRNGNDWRDDEFIGTCCVCGESIYADDTYETCHNCGEHVCADCYTTIDGEAICDDCMDDATSTCIDCGEVLLNENGKFDDDGFRCGRCYTRHETELEEQAKAEVLIEEDETIEEEQPEIPPRPVRQPQEIEPEEFTPQDVTARCSICGQVDANANMHDIGNGAYLCDVCFQQTEVN